jgi:hypothetical protein
MQDGFNAKTQKRKVARIEGECGSVTNAHRLVAGTAKGNILFASSRLCSAMAQNQAVAARFFTTDFTDSTDKTGRVSHPWNP